MATYTNEQLEILFEKADIFVQTLNEDFVKGNTWICGDFDETEVRFKIGSNEGKYDVQAAEELEKKLKAESIDCERYRPRGILIQGPANVAKFFKLIEK